MKKILIIILSLILIAGCTDNSSISPDNEAEDALNDNQETEDTLNDNQETCLLYTSITDDRQVNLTSVAVAG